MVLLLLTQYANNGMLKFPFNPPKINSRKFVSPAIVGDSDAPSDGPIGKL